MRRLRMKLLIPFILPVIALLCWLASGRENLTKSGRPVQVTSVDPIYGGENTKTEFKPGPGYFLGYYIGLDAVGGAAVAAAALSGALWLLSWRESRRARSEKKA